jgi:hypothetical protein
LSNTYQPEDSSSAIAMPRTNIAVDDGVARQLADEAARANKTLYGFANESLQTVLKVLHERGSVEEIYPFWLQTKLIKEFDGTPRLSRSLMDSLVREMYPKDSEALLDNFY